MENGEWKMENGEWKMENGKWKMGGSEIGGHARGRGETGTWG
jgi:hypothetical protein